MEDKKLIFRIFDGGAATNSDWHEYSQFPYDDKNRDCIQVGNGDKASDEITSIPSPFARIDIAKNAFKEVCKRGLDGKTIFHKTVSDVLDVGEIFFNYDKFKDMIEIIKWDPQNMQALKDNNVSGTKYLGEALNNYWNSDAKTYNFRPNQNIYILRYIYGDSTMEVIGATSPATVFFSSANDLSKLSSKISFGKDHPFDKEYCPLYKRDKDYIKAWCIIRKSIPSFSMLMPEVDDYLNLTIQRVGDDELRKELNGLSATDASQYQTITTTTAGSTNTVEIFNHELLMKVSKPVPTSDFTLVPSKEANSNGPLPLVLPIEPGNVYENFIYTQETFGKEAHAPYYDKAPMGSRRLPYDRRVQDYLTISDFLEDYIIKVPHKMNSDDFYNPMTFNDKDGCSEEFSYLIPLKELFFKYFSLKDLEMGFQKNKVGIKIDKLAGGGADVILQIPVKGHGMSKVITYERRYSGEADIENNKGGIETFDFDAFVMPLVKDKNVERAFYTVGCISTKTRDYNFKFFAGEKAVLSNVDCRNENSRQEYKATSYTIRKSYFDYIQVSNGDGLKGLILPKFKNNNGTTVFNFSIDVGTSNTHIAYSKDKTSNIEDFHYGKGDSLFSPVFITTTAIVGGVQHFAGLAQEDAIILRDFLPQEIGVENLYKFPTRTVLTCAKSYKLGQATSPYGLYNASLTYDKIEQLDYNSDKCNIKWDKDESALKAYISCLLLMIRNKILLNDGDLSQTQVTWFFPTSMPMKRKNQLREIWNSLYKEYIGENETSYMTESVAPIHYLFNTQANAYDVVSIDIGGGTTDIAFAKQKKILSVSSFRFACNDLFENSLAPGNSFNGIVDYFTNVLKKNINDNDPSDDKSLTDIMMPLFNEETHDNPANMASFLFSLKENENLINLNPDVIDFNLLLNRDENFKIIFILFYTAILFHIGKTIKYKDYDLPGIISFSGNGSKLLSVITSNKDDLAQYTKLILEIVSEKKYVRELDIVGLDKNNDPKTSTCKGGLKVKANSLASDPIVALKADGSGEIEENKSLIAIDEDSGYQQRVVKTVKDFFHLTLQELPTKYKFKFDDHFGVTSESMEIAKKVMDNNLDIFLKKGIDLLIDNNGENELVSQTMFFIPIKGVLNEMSNKIYQSLSE
jgi:hypothetical protein